MVLVTGATGRAGSEVVLARSARSGHAGACKGALARIAQGLRRQQRKAVKVHRF